ncbi:MAG: cyclic 2,3-diphosphoglycerate synthase [Ignisphaera sp.]
MTRRVVVIGAGGRDIHNFIAVLKRDPSVEVVAFLFTQIPGAEFRRIPRFVAGDRYPSGIPIYPLDMLPNIVKFYGVDEAILCVSDLTYEELGRIISYVLSTGCNFRILGLRETMLDSIKPVIAVTATKTGAGKSTVSKVVVQELRRRGLKVSVIRHPMIYRDFGTQLVQVFKSLDDLDKYGVTVEEREEIEPHLELGSRVLLGVDYASILIEAEKLGDVILWDGGNNDWPFYRPWYWITVTDGTRPGIEVNAYPGEVNIRLADAIIITKVGEAKEDDINKIIDNVRKINKDAHIVKADFVVEVDNVNEISGKRVVVVEDAPTVTHGGLPYGAGYIAAKKFGAMVINPRDYAVGYIKKIYELYTGIGPVVPSLGYTPQQLKDLEETINRVPADAVVLGTPARIERIIKINKPVVRVFWHMKIVEGPSIEALVDEFLSRTAPKNIY